MLTTNASFQKRSDGVSLPIPLEQILKFPILCVPSCWGGDKLANPGQPLDKCCLITKSEGHLLPQWHKRLMLLILVLSAGFCFVSFSLIPQSQRIDLH